MDRAFCRQCTPTGLQRLSTPKSRDTSRPPRCRAPHIRIRAAAGRDGREQRYQEQAYPQQSADSELEAGEEVGQQQQQGYPLGPPPPGYQQQYYQGYPPYPPPYPIPETRSSQGAGIPAFIWVGVGVLAAVVYSKVSSFFRGGPQAAQARMMGWAMEQAMNKAQKGGAAGAPPFPPFGGAGGMPNFGAGFSPPPPASFGGSASGQPGGPAFDVTPDASAAARSGAAAETADAAGAMSNGSAEARGSRFEELKRAQEAGGGARRRGESKPKSRAAFQDVDEEEASTSAAASNGGAGAFRQAEVVGEGAEAAAGGEEGSGKFTVDLMDQFFRDPNMQQLLYKYLPEPMRNPQTFEWMLSNPEYRKQLEAMMQQQGMNLDPNLMSMMKGMDSGDVNAQLESLGLSPSEVINKIMAEPDLAAAFQKPKVMQAIMESQSNPMAIMNYQDDPDVMLVFEKMAKLFPQTAEAPGPQ